MIEYSNEIFDTVATAVCAAHPDLRVALEYLRRPTEFPCLTLDEISNIPVHMDNTTEDTFARVTYRAQIFTNEQTGKRDHARAILSTLDDVFRAHNFVRVTYTTRPELYRSNYYVINVTYEAVIGSDGKIYRSKELR